MNARIRTHLCALLIALPGAAAADAAAPQAPLVNRISFAPLPLQIFMQAGQKPAVVFTTPCVQIEKATNGFPPFLAFEQFMFEMVGKINDSEALPVRLEPVCI
ncbi:MAG: hypothetical protein AB1593_08805 [Pseudomonadota bacterium]